MLVMFRTIAKNSIWLSASQIAARIIGFLYFIFLARYLGVADFGIYTFTLSFVYNFIPIADFGVERLVLRDLSRTPEKTEYYFHRLLPLRIFLAFGAYLLIIVLALLLKQSGRQIGYFALFGLSLFSINITYLISGILNSRERMEFQAIANILQIFFTVLIGAILVFNKLGLTYILFAFPLSNWIVALFFITKSKKWSKLVNGQVQQAEDVTLMTFVRNLIHHPENTNNGKCTPQELKSSVDELIKLVKNH